MKIKICGITNFKDALAAVEFGAGMLGFNFYAKSARFIAPEKAGEIAGKLPNQVLKVGVFVNESVENVNKIAEIASLDIVQLHGDESPDFVKRIRNFRVLKALGVNSEFKIERAVEFQTPILLDAYCQKTHGGTGKTFDWQTAVKVKELVPELYLAGGLSPENIGAAIETVRPFGVDACSLIESQPGKKDLNKMREFIENAKKASENL